MIKEQNELALGIDLGPHAALLTFYNRKNAEPMTVSLSREQEQYEIPVPETLFSRVEERSEEGTEALAAFFSKCLELLSGLGSPDAVFPMVTMRRMRPHWALAITQAWGKLGVPAEHVYLQEYLESFYYYMINQRKELWNYNAALFEHEKDRITGYVLYAGTKTKPALVRVDQAFHLYVDEKARDGMPEAEWQQKKDALFLEKIRELFDGRVFSSAYLTGAGFDKDWARESLRFLCTHRKVFMGQNLFTKGACYGAMAHCGMAPAAPYLYAGADMIEHNIGMEMLVRGVPEYYPMITAGINWYMARHECEFILDDTADLVFHSRSVNREEMTHTVTLTDLPPRPNRATRIHLMMEFTAKNRCRVQMEDLGLGALYPSSGKQWEAVIAL